MAITRIIGFDGGVTMPSGFNAKITAYSCSLDMVLSETTVFGDTFRQFRGGLQGGSGSLTGKLVYDATTTTPGYFASRTTPGQLVLKQATGCTLTGDALFQNISVTSDVGGDATITMDFTFTGTIAEAWDQS